MEIVVVLFIFVVTAFFLYKRYVPVYGLTKIEKLEDRIGNTIVVDTRDFQTDNKVEHAYHIPVAYIHRYSSDIPAKDVIIVAADYSGKNISARLLRSKGIRVIGYTLMNEEGGMNS
jgi:hypothetical protein